MTTTDDTVERGELVQYGSAIEELSAYIAGLEPEDDAEVQDRILRSILSASSPEDLVKAGGTVPTEELLNIHLRAHAIHPDESRFESGPGWYLHVDVETVANGDRMTMRTGAADVVVKLVQAARRGWLPLDFKMEKAQAPSKAGYYPIFMRSVAPAF